MSNKSSVRLSAVLLFVAFVVTALVAEDFVALAQNANSGTPEESMQSNTNGNMTRRGRRRSRRGRRTTRAANVSTHANADATAAPADANLSTDANASAMQGPEQDANRSTTGSRRRRRGRRSRSAAAPADANVSTDANVSQDTGTTTDTSADTNTNLGGGSDEDLSGTYTGNVTMTGGHEMSGPGTLTITSNSFTLEAGGMTHNGRIRAVTTRGYTGATLWFTDITDAVSNTPLAADVRARKSGDRLTLSPVPGTRNRLTFASGGGGGGRRRRGR